jgi:hypothetical protein
MKIHFCDLCNESVPQVDLDQGRAFIRKDRVICAACDRAMSHHLPGAAGLGAEMAGPSETTANFTESPAHEANASRSNALGSIASGDSAPDSRRQESTANAALLAAAPAGAEVASRPAAPGPAPSAQPISSAPGTNTRVGNGAMWVAVLGLFFTAGAIFVLDDRLHVADDRYAALEGRVGKNITSTAGLERSVALANDAHRDLDRRLTARIDLSKTRQDSTADEVAQLKSTQGEIAARLAELALGVKALQDKSGSGDFDLAKRFADYSAKIAKNEDALRALGERITVLESAPPPAAEPVAVESSKPAEPGWKALLPDLQSSVNTLRWSAVDSLGASKDPEVVPHIVPMLKDADVFVRMAAARVLGDLAAKSAVGPLIDALEDGETAVREAAFVALRTITGKDLKFDPLAPSDAERARRVKAWRDWWKKESEPSPQ